MYSFKIAVFCDVSGLRRDGRAGRLTVTLVYAIHYAPPKKGSWSEWPRSVWFQLVTITVAILIKNDKGDGPG